MTRQNKRRVFLTGAGGFVGANLVRALLTKNYEVHILNHNKIIPWRLMEIADQITFHKGDITHYHSLRIIVKNIMPDYIIHLAVYGAYHFQTDLEKIVKVNIVGTENLLRATKEIPYLSFINTGTSSEYGFKPSAMKETDACNPASYYAATKLGATQMCKVFSQIENKPVVTLRLFSVYGPYEEYTRLIPSIMYALRMKKPINLSPGHQRRDFIHIDDVCRAYLKAMKLGLKLQSEIINIGTGKEYTNEEIVHRIFTVTNRSTKINKGTYPSRSWDTLHWRAATDHATEALGFNAHYSIDKGLQKTYSWLARNIQLYQPFYEKNQF